MRLAIVLFLDGLKSFENIFGDVEWLAKVEAFPFALFLEVAPLSLNALLKFLSRPQDVRTNIVALTVVHHQFEVVFDLPGTVVLTVFEAFDDGGDVNGLFDFFVVVWECDWVHGLPEYFGSLLLDEFVDHDQQFFLDCCSLFAHNLI